MRRPASFVLALVLGAASPQGAAAAAPSRYEPPVAEPPVAIAVVAGVATAIVPMVLGAMHIAAQGQTPDTDGARNVGFAVSGVGPALAPIVAHAVLGEWKRAAIFGAAPVAAEIGLCAYLAAMPDAVFQGTKTSRLGFGLIYTADLFGAALGMVDVMMAHERARVGRRGPDPLGGVRVIPSVGPGRAGLVLGGAW